MQKKVWSDAVLLMSQPLNNFNYPAAKVRPLTGPSIVTVNDLLEGEIKESNPAAQALGITIGMKGKTALDLLS